MAVEQGLFQLVTQNAGVQAAVGADANGTTQAYWILAPQGAVLPFLVFSRVATTDPYAMSGTIGLREGLFQIVCYANNYYGSRTAAAAVRSCLENYIGTLPDGTVVNSVLTDKDWDHQYEEGGKSFIYGAYLQFRVWFQG
jgi:hypothetical protein